MYQFIGFNIIFKRIKAIKYMMKDKSVPKRKKILVIFGIIYLLWPVDLIPPILFPIAWVDDFILWVWILWHLKDELDKYWIGDSPEDLSKKYKGKTIIDDVSFQVEPEENEQDTKPSD
ncbi:YkvA family protein [Clostridium aminobutyricum]|uniref:DUF1232 domain-containing protein n=1 Tax=Clostridium aminobutyricum TaxID=33953 RepID=A0A939II68_CLOAM|nr:DUF1232 domain-containing protein [Clostridium aminobutyricum]MBN7774612.1 DUF1232 domain-containing protein [Clostridium aminobutyricum]